ncbi:MAG: ADP-ribosylglycohydrolase family protein [Planctomycetota bacterium]
MPYFNRLEEEVRELSLWADVRHEQGLPVKGRMAALARQVRSLRRELAGARRTAAQERREPNALKAIRPRRPAGPRRLWERFRPGDYADRVRGAFLGRAAGCTLGAPVEGWTPDRMEALAAHNGDPFPPTDYWSYVDAPYQLRYGADARVNYTRGGIRHIPVDDDMTYTVLGLLILEDYGPGFTTADVGAAWVKYLPVACTAEKVALANLKAGVSWRQAGVKGNPYMEWIGADIRSDPWGYACPGWPEMAAEMAYRDAYISHRYNGIYGEMYFSAAIAAAFAVDDPVEALHVALTEIPRSCRLYEDLTWALKVAPRVTDHVKAYRLVQQRFGPARGGMSTVHTNNNACLTVWGVSIGGRDLTRAIATTVAMGYDNDCTAATVGSIVGAAVGGRNIPDHWARPFRNRCHTYIKRREWFRISDICRRFGAVAKATFAAKG